MEEEGRECFQEMDEQWYQEEVDVLLCGETERNRCLGVGNQVGQPLVVDKGLLPIVSGPCVNEPDFNQR
ncbi:hypothetical protein A2U01_0014488 [Trifolium medium]|uniref:Uncharacterized protein n=1 Tax=Trifolium medium TaxID=97028 RepID=A0A392N163_9FABA|nr:hypothetical protein [Trifolium medium]